MKKIINLYLIVQVIIFLPLLTISCKPNTDHKNPNPEIIEKQSLSKIPSNWDKMEVNSIVELTIIEVGNLLLNYSVEENKKISTEELRIYENNSQDPMWISDNLKPGQTYTIKPIQNSIYFKDFYKKALNKVSLEDLYQGDNYYIWSSLVGIDLTNEIQQFVLIEKLFNIKYAEFDQLMIFNLVNNNFLGYQTKIIFKAKKGSNFLIENDSYELTFNYKLLMSNIIMDFYELNKEKVIGKTKEEFELNLKDYFIRKKQVGIVKYINLNNINFNEKTLINGKIIKGTEAIISITENRFFYSEDCISIIFN